MKLPGNHPVGSRNKLKTRENGRMRSPRFRDREAPGSNPWPPTNNLDGFPALNAYAAGNTHMGLLVERNPSLMRRLRRARRAPQRAWIRRIRAPCAGGKRLAGKDDQLTGTAAV